MMDHTLERVTATGLQDAIESRDGDRLGGFYADDAELRVIDCQNTPSHPRILQGREAISAHWRDVCARAMTHSVDFAVSDERRIAFTESCTYPDGMRVFAAATLDLEDGRITRQTLVQAWDA